MAPRRTRVCGLNGRGEWTAGRCGVLRLSVPMLGGDPPPSAPQKLSGLGRGLTGGSCWWEKVISKGSARLLTGIRPKLRPTRRLFNTRLPSSRLSWGPCGERWGARLQKQLSQPSLVGDSWEPSGPTALSWRLKFVARGPVDPGVMGNLLLAGPCCLLPGLDHSRPYTPDQLVSKPRTRQLPTAGPRAPLPS